MTHARLDRRPPASVHAPWRAAAGVAVLGVVVSGCMTSKVDETRQIASPIQANESIVLLKKPQLEGVGTEEAFLEQYKTYYRSIRARADQYPDRIFIAFSPPPLAPCDGNDLSQASLARAFANWLKSSETG